MDERHHRREPDAIGYLSNENIEPKPDLTCARKGCAERGVAYPVLYVWALGDTGGATEDAAMLRFEGLKVCPGHGETLRPEHLIDDAGWDALLVAFAAAGQARPDRETIRVTLERLT